MIPQRQNEEGTPHQGDLAATLGGTPPRPKRGPVPLMGREWGFWEAPTSWPPAGHFGQGVRYLRPPRCRTGC
jgi:hypothetical protein